MTRATSSRRQGYALVLVLVFIGLVNLFFVLSYKHVSSALRVQTAQRLSRERDDGQVAALAAGLAFLELTEPLSVDDGGYGYQYSILIGETTYTVTFTPPAEGEQSWSVYARPEELTDPAGLLDLREQMGFLRDAIAAGRAEFDQAYAEYPAITQYEYDDDEYYIVTFSQIDPPTNPQWRMTTRPKLPE